LLNAQNIARNLLDALRDGPAMLRFKKERLQNEDVHGTLRKFEMCSRHIVPLSLLQETIRDLLSKCKGRPRSSLARSDPGASCVYSPPRCGPNRIEPSPRQRPR